jgi:hypothetical protein
METEQRSSVLILESTVFVLSLLNQPQWIMLIQQSRWIRLRKSALIEPLFSDSFYDFRFLSPVGPNARGIHHQIATSIWLYPVLGWRIAIPGIGRLLHARWRRKA